MPVHQPVDRADDAARRSVVPEAAGRSLWLSAAWTGVGAAVVCATLAIAAVAICWLPVSGASSHSRSAIHAGLLAFLAALHGGVTVDGAATAFLPLGMTIIVGLTAWRAGAGLADVANSLGERDPLRLGLAGAAQAASFALTCLVAVPFATLGTSRAPFVGVGVAALVLFTLTGGVAFVRAGTLGEVVTDRLPAFAGPVLRAAGAAIGVYVGVGALLVAGSLVIHLTRVEALSRQVGGGWSSVPILLLGMLAAPNAAIAGAAYLAGPGFTVGTGATVSAVTTAHGVLPAFPLLGAMPQGHGANGLAWGLVVLTPLAAGLAVARLLARAGSWRERLGGAVAAALLAGSGLFVLAWQGGGGIGTGRLRTVGASPWRVGLFVTAEVTTVAVAGLCAVLAFARVQAARGRPSDLRVESTIGARRDLLIMTGAGAGAGAGADADADAADADETDDADDADADDERDVDPKSAGQLAG